MMVSTMRFTPPTSPTPTVPVLMPIPARSSSEPSAFRSRLCSRKERSIANPGPDGVGLRFEDGDDLVPAYVLDHAVVADDRELDGPQKAHRQVARLGDVHVLEHGRVAPDIADEHRHLAFDPVAAADAAKVVDVEDAQQFVGHEPRLHVHEGLPMLVGGPQSRLELEVPQRRGSLGAQEGDRLLVRRRPKFLPDSSCSA